MEAAGPYESEAFRRITGPAVRPGGFLLTDRAIGFHRPSPGASVLDVGCGLGATVDHLAQAHGLKAVGLDASFHMLGQGPAEGFSNSGVVGLADRLPFPDGFFDMIFCECVLSLLDDPEGALVQMNRVLGPKGCLVVTDLYARGEKAVGHSHPNIRSCLLGARPQKEIIKMAQASGFTPLLWEDHTRLLNGLAAKLVFELGSMEALWSYFGIDSGSACGLKSAKPGYYLMVAEKGAAEPHLHRRESS